MYDPEEPRIVKLSYMDTFICGGLRTGGGRENVSPPTTGLPKTSTMDKRSVRRLKQFVYKFSSKSGLHVTDASPKHM